MTKTCIICNNPAGSGEHVFPAAFGGRRTNRGIYCESHNNAFGRHVETLLSGLDIVNAIIGVIPDRHKEIRPAPAKSADGERFLFSRVGSKIAPPQPLNETPELVGKRVKLKFADQKQAIKWIAEQEKAGFRIETEPAGPNQTQIIAHPLHAPRYLGDEAFMRALLYIGLTFLAHVHPKLARAPGLADVRKIVEEDGKVEDRVLWEPPHALEQLSANPFPYGNTVAIGPITNTSRIGALISFYGAIQFSVDLGKLPEVSCLERITTHIDPLAKNPPDDIDVIREEGISLVVSTPSESRKYLNELRTGQTTNPLMSVLQSASYDALSETCEALLPELMATKSMPPSQRPDRVMALLAAHDQRIFNLMREGIQNFIKSAPDLPAPIRFLLNSFISGDDSAPRGLDCTSDAALVIAKASLADSILNHINDDTLNGQTLAELLGGGKGISAVLRPLTEIVANALPR